MMRTEDGDLIYRCLNGEPEAFGFLADKYKESVYGLAYAMLLNFDDAEDVTQEVFITAYKKLHSLKNWDSFRLWLYSITRNACKMFMRSKLKRPDKEYLEDKDTDTLEKPSLDAYRKDSDWKSLNDSLYDALNSLPEMYRQVLSLYYLSEMTSKEISESLVISPMTVLQRLNRARALLKKEMLDMMTEAFENRKLAGGFTFCILESIKRIKIQPMTNTNGVPWGLSLATGIIFAILGLNPNFNNPAQNNVSIGNSLSGESRVLEFGEIPVNITRIADKSVMSKATGNGDGINPAKIQNAMFMAPQGEGGIWSQKADMDTPRLAHGVCAVNGKLYAFGGYDKVNGDPKWITTIDEYDPKLNKWIKKSDMPDLAWFGYTALNGKIYIIGGQNINMDPFLTTNYEYDPSSNTWTKKADMPTGRALVGVTTANGKIYAIGGISNAVTVSKAVEEYDPLTDKWTKKADKPNPTIYFSVASVNNKIYVFGGDDNGLMQTVYEYDPIADAWKLKDSKMPTSRVEMSACELNGKIYVIGGHSDNFNANIDSITTVEEYDPILDSWEKKEDMPTKRMCCPATSLDGKIYVVGGSQKMVDRSYFSLISTVEEYTPEGWKAVSPKGKLPTTWGAEKKR
jgi:RNA polymerase sigma factor (sigma-70 family)